MTNSASSSGKIVSIEVARRSKLAQPTLDVLFQQDMTKSGITLGMAHRVGFALHGPDDLWATLHPKNPDRPSDFTAEGFVMPYFDPAGKRLPYSRVRKLRGKWSKDDDGHQRYASPVNSLPHLYLPTPLFPELPAKGAKIRVDRLLITEGEKKAIKACSIGLACIAIGGVDAYRSMRHGITLLHEFSWFDLTATDIEVVYDSDTYHNPDVDRALRGISGALRRDVAPGSLRQKRLTSENAGTKVALDDFLASFPTPEAARRAYDKLETRDDPISEAFETFNREIAHVRLKTKYYNIATGTWYPSQKQVVEEYARGKAALDADGKVIHPINKWFTERPVETEVLDVQYSPGKPERFKIPHIAGDVLNTWRPGPLLPTPFKRLEQVAEFLRFVEYLTPGLSDTERAFLYDWSAYPIRHLGRKNLSAVMIWSADSGTGKNTFARIMKRIHGETNTWEIDGTTLMSSFNNWALRQFIIINEVDQPSYNERAAVMARLKTLITEETIDLERKYLPRENVPNHANLYLTSNKHDALTLDEDDRRFFVVQGPDEGAKWSSKQFRDFNAWLDTGGVEKVYGFLLKRNLKGFDPYAPPPRTAARAEMLSGKSNPLEDLMQILTQTPAKVLGADIGTDKPIKPSCELYLPGQLIEHLQVLAQKRGLRLKLTLGMLGASLKKHKIVKRSFEIQRNGRHLVTVYAIFNSDRWSKANENAWRTHLLEHNEGLFQ